MLPGQGDGDKGKLSHFRWPDNMAGGNPTHVSWGCSALSLCNHDRGAYGIRIANDYSWRARLACDSNHGL